MLKKILSLFNRPPKRHPKDQLGQDGENEAAKHLKSKKYKILARNVQLPSGEIDIIAKDADWLVFVEVKTRNFQEGMLAPEANVTAKKRKKLRRLAYEYLKKESLGDVPYRFDIVSVVKKDGDFILEHFEQAF